jgi:stage II sporulation protein D
MDKKNLNYHGYNYLNRYARSKRRFGSIRFRGYRIADLILFLIPLIIIIAILPSDEAELINHKEKPAAIITDNDNIKIIVYNPDDSLVDELLLEEYVKGVVAAEMPAHFEKEALKAQAVAARTFALSRMQGLYGSSVNHFGAAVCTDPGHCQAWVSKEEYINTYGNEEAWDKISTAVDETKNMVMTYSGVLINPLYHSNSGGATEDIDAVWNTIGEVPYLKSVYSPDEDNYAEYHYTTGFTWDEIREKVISQYPDAVIGSNPAEELEVLKYSPSGRVVEIRVGTAIMPGTKFRELFSLNSTNLEINFPDERTVSITSIGFGHGVGMSQCGADALAKKGLLFKDILEFYYTGVIVEEIE